MTSGQKISVSLLISVIAFAFFAVLSLSGQFEYIEAKFYQPAVRRPVEQKVTELAENEKQYNQILIDRFAFFLSNDAVLSSVKSKADNAAVRERENLWAKLKVDSPSLLALRIVDSNGRKIHFSTFDSDKKKQDDRKIIYEDYTKLVSNNEEIEFDTLKCPEDKKFKIFNDKSNKRIIYAIPFIGKDDSEKAVNATALFYCSTRDFLRFVYSKNLLSILEKDNAEYLFTGLPDAGGYVFGLPQPGPQLSVNGIELLKDSITKKIKSNIQERVSAGLNFANLNSSGIIEDTVSVTGTYSIVDRVNSSTEQIELEQNEYSTDAAGEQKNLTSTYDFVLFTKIVDFGENSFGFVSVVCNAEDFKVSDTLRILLLSLVFLTLFLSVFLILNLKRDDMVVIKDRIRRFQNAFIKAFKKQQKSKKTSLDIKKRKDEFEQEIKKSLGRRAKKYSQQVEELLEQSWTEILAATGTEERAETQNSTPNAKIDSKELKNVLEEILTSGKLNIKVESAPVAQQQKPELPEVEEAEPAEELEEAEDAEPAEDLEEVDELEEVDDAEPAEELEEVDDAEPADELEEVADAETAEELEEVADVEPAEELEEVADAETAEELEEVADVEPAEELEEVADVEPAEELEEIEDAEPAEELDEVAAVEPAEELEEVDDVETADDAESADELEEVADAETADELEEVADAEPADELEEADDADLAEDLEEVAAVEPAEELEEVADAESADELEEVADAEPVDEFEEVKGVEPAEELEEVKGVEPAEELEEVADAESADELEEAEEAEPVEELEEVADAEPAEELEEVADAEPALVSVPEDKNETTDVDLSEFLDDAEPLNDGQSPERSAEPTAPVDEPEDVANAKQTGEPKEAEVTDLFMPVEPPEDDADFEETIGFGVPEPSPQSGPEHFSETDLADDFVVAPVDFSFLDNEDEDSATVPPSAEARTTDSAPADGSTESSAENANPDDFATARRETENSLQQQNKTEEREEKTLQPTDLNDTLDSSYAPDYLPPVVDLLSDLDSLSTPEIPAETEPEEEMSLVLEEDSAFNDGLEEKAPENATELESLSTPFAARPFMFAKLGAETDNVEELVPLNSKAIVEAEDGTFYIQGEPDSSEVVLNSELKTLVESVLK